MRGRLALVGGITLGAAVVGGAAYGLPSGSAQTPDEGGRKPVPATATVARQTLQSVEDLDGTLGYAGDGIVVTGLMGTVTVVPQEGDVLERGDTILEVDGRDRATLLYGSRPAWRTLKRYVRDGRDVRQLEDNLRAMGYLRPSVTPDQHFDATTRDAVKAWQADRNVRRDGVIRFGEVVFTNGPIRVTSVSVALGASVGPGATVATTTSAQRIVTAQLRADRQDILSAGTSVGITLPDDTETRGTVASISRVADASSGTPMVDVEIVLDDPATAGSLDGASVTVNVIRERRENVLTVPVDALLALLEGGYAVEVVDGPGESHLVAVQLGLFQDTDVQVTGNMSEGDLVVVPA